MNEKGRKKNMFNIMSNSAELFCSHSYATSRSDIIWYWTFCTLKVHMLLQNVAITAQALSCGLSSSRPGFNPRLVHVGIGMDKAALGQVSLPAPVSHCHNHPSTHPSIRLSTHPPTHPSIHTSIHPSITEATEYWQFTASLNSTNAAKLRLKAIITLVLRGLVHPSQRLAPLVSQCE